MSALQAVNLKNAASANNSVVLGVSGNATFVGTTYASVGALR